MSKRRLRCSLLYMLFLITILGSCKGIPTEPIEERIRGADVQEAICATFGLQRFQVMLLDGIYLAYTEAAVEEQLRHGEWIASIDCDGEFADCDDFAFGTMDWVRNPLFGLKGAAFGVMKVWQQDQLLTHCLNVFVDSKLVVWTADLKERGPVLELADGSLKVYWVII